MTYEVYRYIFIGGAILSVIMLIVSILLFVFLKIPRVVGDLTGRTAKKAIENIREQNINSGDKKHKVSAVNAQRGKLTDKITATGSTVKKDKQMNPVSMTEKIHTQELEGSNETTVLDSGETTVLSSEMNLSGETDVLNDSSYANSLAFEIEFDITFVHTNEVIP